MFLLKRSIRNHLQVDENPNKNEKELFCPDKCKQYFADNEVNVDKIVMKPSLR
jgi:hypothetical protein